MITLHCKLTFENEKDKEKLKVENNKYKKKSLKRKITDLNKQIKLIKSLYSEPQTQEPVNRRKKQVRGWQYVSYKLWRVVKVALTMPVLGKFLPRDLSPLKPILVLGEWDRIVKLGLVPVAWDRGDKLCFKTKTKKEDLKHNLGVDKYRQLGTYPHLKKAEYKYPSPKCS